MKEPDLKSEIHNAAFNGEVNLIREYLAKDQNLIHHLDPIDLASPLVNAIEGGHSEAVSVLIEAGARLDYANKNSNQVLIHLCRTNIPKAERKKIQQLLAEAMLKKFKELYWDFDLPLHEKKQTLITLLLNLIVYSHKKRNFPVKKDLLEKLQLELHSLLVNKTSLSLKEFADIYSFVGSICTQAGATKDALEYYQTAIHFYIKPLESASNEEEQVSLLTHMTKIYKEMLEQLQEDKNPITLLPYIEKMIDVHISLQKLLKNFASLAPTSLAQLKVALLQFYKEVTGLREKTMLEKQKPSLSSASKLEITSLPIPKQLLSLKRTHDSLPAVSKLTSPATPVTLYWKENPVSILTSVETNTKEDTEKQESGKRVKFDLSQASQKR